jgi:TRAP-type C4-dicarboxylate transport system permease large subunit
MNLAIYHRGIDALKKAILRAVAGILYCLFLTVIIYRQLIVADVVKSCWETARITSL